MYLLFPKWALRSVFDGLTQATPVEQPLKQLTPMSLAKFLPLSSPYVFRLASNSSHSMAEPMKLTCCASSLTPFCWTCIVLPIAYSVRS